MGSIMSAIRDDENDWDDFWARHLRGTAPQQWDLYSDRQRFAVDIYRKESVTGKRLLDRVEEEVVKAKKAKEAAEKKERQKLFLKLKKEFEPTGGGSV